MCQKAPIVKPPDDLLSLLLGLERRKRQAIDDDNDDSGDGFDDFSDFYGDEDDLFAEVVSDKHGEDGKDMADFAETFSVAGYPDPYCDIVNKMKYACFEMSLLELWANDGEYNAKTDRDIADLTLADVLDKINQPKQKSGVFLIERNFTDLLSNVERDSSGRIVKAKATVMRWFGKMNVTNAKENPVKNRGEPLDLATLDFEGAMLKVMLNTSNYPAGLESYPNVKRSFGDVAGSTILGDVGVMAIGYNIVFVYVLFMLGKFNAIEQRAYLSAAGIIGVIMGIVVSYGVCSAFGLFFGPMHSVLPFLLLGIGIDDMFVIVQCWDTLEAKRKKKNKTYEDEGDVASEDLSIPDRMGQTLSHAGVAITITSVTDIIAFGVGGTTVLPALKSFCIYASVGIVATYWFQCTFFVAWMSLDIRRAEANRNACLPCVKHRKDWKTNRFSQRNFSRSFFIGVGKALTKTPVKVFVILLTLAIAGVGVWGNVLLRQEFDPTWFLPPETYLAKWFVANREYFPFGGDRVTIWCADVDLYTEFDKLNMVAKELKEQTDIVDKVDSWTLEFEAYLDKHFEVNVSRLEETEFKSRLAQFFYSPKGGRYRELFKFGPVSNTTSALDESFCGEDLPKVLLSQMTFQHRIFTGPEEHVPAMNRVKDVIRAANISGRVFPISIGYASWETDEVIAFELYRNIALAVVCVFITTLFLLSNFIASLLVLSCVLLSLVDVGGYMHFWGLTIDTVSCNNLIIAIGLCVDYSAHIAHR